MTIPDAPPGERAAEAVPAAPKRPGLNTDTVAMGALFISIFAFLAAVFAVALAARAVEESRSSGGSGGSMSGAATVSLSEFSLTPGDVKVSSGGTVEVINEGSMIHNLSVDGVVTPMLDGGESAELDLAGLKPGAYKMKCDIPGHEDAGMKGTLTIE